MSLFLEASMLNGVRYNQLIQTASDCYNLCNSAASLPYAPSNRDICRGFDYNKKDKTCFFYFRNITTEQLYSNPEVIHGTFEEPCTYDVFLSSTTTTTSSPSTLNYFGNKMLYMNDFTLIRLSILDHEKLHKHYWSVQVELSVHIL